MHTMLPDTVRQAWENREGPLVLTTVNKNGRPNSIYASVVNIMKDGRIAVADNYFCKTKANIDLGGKACALFITREGKSFQLKGALEYHDSGPLYEEMLEWADPKHPRKGVAIFNAEEIYRGKDKIA
jgi:uncharacterized protein